jgi:RNA polymerase sigma-70 factor (ECF subfamily)
MIPQANDPSRTFEPYRRRLRGLSYRMLGSIAEAEDAVQETYLRWHAADRSSISDPKAFLITTTTRICLDVLRSARARREQYVGPWLPDPVVDTDALAPDAQAELAEDLSVALLLALDRLSPLERAAFLLHDVFDYSYPDIARALDRTEAACRQLASRARAHVRTTRPTLPASSSRGASATSPEHAELISAFVSASQSGDVSRLMSLLTRDATFVSDGGGKVPAALRVIEGADRVARLVASTAPKGWGEVTVARSAIVNGLPGMILEGRAGVIQTVALEIEDDLVRTIYVVRNPDKLKHLARA